MNEQELRNIVRNAIGSMQPKRVPQPTVRGNVRPNINNPDFGGDPRPECEENIECYNHPGGNCCVNQFCTVCDKKPQTWVAEMSPFHPSNQTNIPAVDFPDQLQEKITKKFIQDLKECGKCGCGGPMTPDIGTHDDMAMMIPSNNMMGGISPIPQDNEVVPMGQLNNPDFIIDIVMQVLQSMGGMAEGTCGYTMDPQGNSLHTPGGTNTQGMSAFDQTKRMS